MSKHNVLIIGADKTSNGGIASVIKTYINTNEAIITSEFNFIPIKTSNYKDKSILYEVFTLIKAIFLFIYYIIVKNVNIVHIHSSAYISFYRKIIFYLLSKLFSKKVILHLHASKFYTFFLNSKGLKKRILNIIFNNVDCVIVLNEDWLHKLKIEFPGVTIKKIFNPIEITELRYIKKDHTFGPLNVLFMGFLIESKGLLDLLKISTLLKDEDIKFTICGKGPLESYIRNHSLNTYNITFKGWIDGSEKIQLFKNADLLILPSYNEGLPIIILEAMHYSLPILATNISGIPEEITNGVNGYLIEPGDIDGIIKHILLFKGLDLERINMMRKSSYDKVKSFSSIKILNEVFAIYKEILKVS